MTGQLGTRPRGAPLLASASPGSPSVAVGMETGRDHCHRVNGATESLGHAKAVDDLTCGRRGCAFTVVGESSRTG